MVRAAHRLALALGEPDPDAMLRRMPGRIWLRWQAYYRCEPWGEVRDDHRAALIADILYHGFGFKQRRTREDFLIVPDKPRGGAMARTTDEMLALMKRMEAAGAARRVRDGA